MCALSLGSHSVSALVLSTESLSGGFLIYDFNSSILQRSTSLQGITETRVSK